MISVKFFIFTEENGLDTKLKRDVIEIHECRNFEKYE